MADRFASLPDRRAIIDRRALADVLDELGTSEQATAQKRASLAILLKDALRDGRTEIARRLAQSPSRGREATSGQAFLIDQIIRLLHDFTVGYLYPAANRSSGERLTLIAVGGYGRGEMAPHSDIDIGFLTPFKQTAWVEQVIESMLYTLWDLGLKVGHSSRSLDEMVRMARSDLSIRTALLESRYIWGDRALYEEATARFLAEVVSGTEKAFVAEKLAERDERHKRMGDSRYVVEPNVKEGKGGLRDLHTLFWIGKYLHKVRTVGELVDSGLLTRDELRQFEKAENFLLAVRCHLHILTNRAEDRLTFDVQREIAARMNFADRPGKSAVERFMQLYFLHAKTVGDVTGVFLAHLDDQLAQRGRRFLPAFVRRVRKLEGFELDRGRITIPSDDWFQTDPVRLIELFALADKHQVEIHPTAMRAARRDAGMIDAKVRKDPRANALFLDILTSRNNPETVLRWMNEAAVFGRFVPDFGRVVAQMQFDMYHHYTVDEHSIRAIGLLARIEKGDLKEDHPLATVIISQLVSRRTLYVAVLLHDIAKGRGGDHSVLGAEVAERLCPRLGLSPAETETVSWLIRHHLLMSATAFKRDLADFKTILDFTRVVQSPERLKLLLALTVVDIRAVGPGVWNGWKRQLLTDLYDSAEEVLRLGHKQRGRDARIAEKKTAVAAALGMDGATFVPLARRMTDSFWIAEPADVAARNLAMIGHGTQDGLAIEASFDAERDATLVSVHAVDHAGLFYRIAGGIHLAGGNIIDARVHTTRDGLAIDNFLVQDPLGRPFNEDSQIARLKQAIADSLANRHRLVDRLVAKPMARARADAFRIEPSAIIDNMASNRFTVIEVNAQDRPALLNQLAYALFQSKVMLHSAHIATYGERAVDTFYVTDLLGGKIENKTRLKTLEKRLVDAAAGVITEEGRAAA
ncbi:[protein-PII] uridylyltransferase [Sphingomonas lacunae]|uniref:Bifunctional uridylyltransferase/uridylyl-removing enzyme n=1 Tax=Sphingomonas lacunae TaxID=2698828 RepID=A0A6M4AXL9_9SPHN|nr:[protein-PII] uridylyltransferase [Sphingomonas lacunae]QJQ31711.1 [protein-PII] uridylyltransferase [Sphingomonas lacunae]